MKRRQRSFRAIYEAQLMRPLRDLSGRRPRTFPTMARALRALPEVWLPSDAAPVFVWSDLHLGHANIIPFNDRPFQDIGHMDQVLFDRWARTVDWSSPDSAIVLVGDIAMKPALTLANFARIQAMPGRKYQVPGNHDFTGEGKLRLEGFDEVCSLLYADGDPKLIFTHVLLPEDELPAGWVNVHGHMHAAPPARSRHINVSVEQLDYAPVELSRIRLLAEAISGAHYPEGKTTLQCIVALEASAEIQTD